MYLNDFSVRVLRAHEVAGGYVELEHNKQYSLYLSNKRPIRCDARVEIDGRHVGTWRLERQQTVKLERPVHDDGRFTFLKSGTAEAAQAGLEAGDPNLGLLKVTFTPELEVRCGIANPMFVPPIPKPVRTGAWMGNIRGHVPDAPMATNSYASSKFSGSASASCGRSAGGTGLTGQSEQEFGQAPPIQYDFSQQTVIHLRLVAVDEMAAVRPLTSFSTPIPPAVV